VAAPKLIEWNGETLSVSEWAKRLGIERRALHYRLRHMPLADALRDSEGRKVVFKRKRSLWVNHEGHIYTHTQFAQLYGVTERTVRNWIRDGHLVSHCETERHCAGCGSSEHQSQACAKLYLEPGGRKVRFGPPTDSELAAVGAPPDPKPARPVGRRPRLLQGAPPAPEPETPPELQETSLELPAGVVLPELSRR
jgi:hypothetical protein